ncbi:MAG: hypothetical protein ACLFPX_07355 [Candidatus Omnitrophota bacterium]
MELFEQPNLKDLYNVKDVPCVSIYLPTDPASQGNTADETRLHNLVSEARRKLADLGARSTDIDAIFAPVKPLFEDREFWEYQSLGLAVFCSPETFCYFRVPVVFQELVTTSFHFHLKPLLPLITRDQNFYILALSQQQVRFFKAHRQGIQEVGFKGPHSKEEAVPHAAGKKNEFYHTRTGKGDGQTPTSYLGHGAETDDTKQGLDLFCRTVAGKVEDRLKDQKAPLILAGVDEVTAAYKNENRYPYLQDQTIEGNPEQWRPEELQKKAWEIVRPVLDRVREEEVERFQLTAAKQPERTAIDIKMIVPAAADGRVQTLFVEEKQQVWAEYQPDTKQFDLHDQQEPADIDLLDLAAGQTLAADGDVFILKKENMPQGASIAAIYRY